MPHLRIEYTGNVAEPGAMDALCKDLALTLVRIEDGKGGLLFPLEGTRVLACPAAHWAVGDGEKERGFVYLNLRIAPGRTAAQMKAAGDALLARVESHFTSARPACQLRVTLHIDVGMPVYEGKLAYSAP
ncbi:MAG: 5-carboxymethyl-2-hydroxymuconate isomerase [Massilia sp.]